MFFGYYEIAVRKKKKKNFLLKHRKILHFGKIGWATITTTTESESLTYENCYF